jgi:branched-chain amino acid transport system permease protein
MNIIAEQILNALQMGVLLFLISSGLSLIFGLMHVVNLAHGALYMAGAYFALTAARLTDSFFLALVLAPLMTAVLGAILERLLLRRTYGQGMHPQVLLTFGLVFCFDELVRILWSSQIQIIELPPSLAGTLSIGDIQVPTYRAFVVVVGVFVVGALLLLFNRTHLGAQVRGSVDDREMAAALGIDVKLLFTFMFSLGAALAGLGGALAVPLFTAYPGMGSEILISALVVVVVGGMGSLVGSLLASLLVSFAIVFGQVVLAEFATAMIYVVLILFMLFRPQGLMGVARPT